MNPLKQKGIYRNPEICPFCKAKGELDTTYHWDGNEDHYKYMFKCSIAFCGGRYGANNKVTPKEVIEKDKATDKLREEYIEKSNNGYPEWEEYKKKVEELWNK